MLLLCALLQPLLSSPSRTASKPVNLKSSSGWGESRRPQRFFISQQNLLVLQLLGWVPRPCPWLLACGSDGAAAAAPCCPMALCARQRGLLCLLSGEFPAPAFLSLSSPATHVVGWGETSRHSKVCCKKQKMVEGANSVWKSPEATAEQEQDLINHCVACLWWLLCAHGYFFFFS